MAAAPTDSGRTDAPRGIPGLPKTVVALGVVSLLTDVSSEMIVPVLPLFVVGVLHTTAAGLGLIEGVAESTAALVRLGSGWLSDRVGQRRPFLLFGYGLSALAKGALALAMSWTAVLGLRFGDRLGKGLRNPPRDALIADSVEPARLGRAFGFHRGLDTLGAAIGPLLAFALLSASPGAYRSIFLLSLIPAGLALVVIAAFVRGPAPAAPAARVVLSAEARGLGRPFRRFLATAGLFSLANSSAAFLLLLAADHAHGPGLAATGVTLVYLLYNVVYAALAWPVGELSDRIGRRGILLAAYLLFAAVYALLAWRANLACVVAGFVLLGVHGALLEASQRSLLGDLVPPGRRGTAYGLYYGVVGAALLPASAVAGALWQWRGPRVALATDAVLALAAAILFAVSLPPRAEYIDRHDHAG